MHNGSANYWSELDVNIVEHPFFEDVGDISTQDYLGIEVQYKSLLQKNTRLLTLGGDHSIAYPIIRAHAQHFSEPFEILQIDAHGDLYHEYDGDKYSHACPFARIMEEGLTAKLTQVGIRAINPHQREQAAKFGVKVIEMRNIEQIQDLQFHHPLYISLDLDGIDPAFAPGVSHHEAGGLTSRQVIDLIQKIDVPIIGADIVEYNPHRDVSFLTAALAAKLLKEIAGKMLG
ncbi:MAG: arginase family protein [Chitinophagales bacterium]